MRTRVPGAVFAVVLTLAIPLQVGGAPRFSEWSEPQNLGCVVNSPVQDSGAALSKNGLSLYFGSTRPVGFGASDLWVSQRAHKDDPWGPPANLGAVINTSAAESGPSLSRDGHYLFFQSARPGGFGLSDIWVSYRENVHDDFAWVTPVNLGPGVNSSMFEGGATYFENEEGGAPQLYFQRGPAGNAGTDIWMSELQPDGTFGPAMLVPELSSPGLDNRPSIRRDGLELFFFSDRDTSGSADIWVSTRESVLDPWGTPVNLGPTVNSAVQDIQPHIAPDRLTLVFVSNRPGGCGGDDLWMTTRTKLKGHDDEDDDDHGHHGHGR